MLSSGSPEIQMIIELAGGCRSDDAPVGPQPFVLYSENLRWRGKQPETIGLQARIRDLLTSNPIVLPPPSRPFMAIFHDRQYIVLAGDTLQVHLLDWETGALTTIETPEAGLSGAWWFVANETHIIGARACLGHTGRVYAIERATLDAQVLPNSPYGALGGGIVAGTLFLAGAVSFAPGPNAPAELTVRWSARRTDASSNTAEPTEGPFGFEDWTPSDVNASGEQLLERGTQIIGGGASSFGGMVWTDRAAYLFTPRADVYTFTEREIAERGLLANQAWCEADGRVWWYDQARALNVFDGGSVSQIPNPLRMASVEQIDPVALRDLYLTPNTGHGEVILGYRDIYGALRQLVYNYRENAWYPWRLNRIGMEDRFGPRPSIGVTPLGELMFDDLSAALDEGYLRGQPADPFPATPTGQVTGLLPVGSNLLVEPFEIVLSTSIISAPEPTETGVRNMNAVLSHTYASPPASEPLGTEYIEMRIDSYDEAARDPTLVHSDIQQIRVGSHGADFRGGGRAMRIFLRATLSSFVRFGALFLGAQEGHHG
jgi:hypothetical protein